MFTAEQRALRTIQRGTTAWEKVKVGLEKAMDVLKGIVSKKAEKIRDLELENAVLMDKIRTTENFISNTDKLYLDEN
jgi:hypothetical protein